MKNKNHKRIIKYQFKKKKLSHSDISLKRYGENTKWKKYFLKNFLITNNKNFAQNYCLFISLLKVQS